jgi:hypothetical protein
MPVMGVIESIWVIEEEEAAASLRGVSDAVDANRVAVLAAAARMVEEDKLVATELMLSIPAMPDISILADSD